MTITATRALTVLSTFGAAANAGDFFETIGSVHIGGRLTPELLDGVLDVLEHRADLGLAVNLSDEFDADVALETVRDHVGHRIRIGIRKPNTEATYYFFTLQGLSSFLDEPEALGARRVLLADLAASFETLACTFDAWGRPVPDDASPNSVSGISPKRFVYDLVGRCPSSIGTLVEKRAPAAVGEAYIMWRSWATQRLRDVIVNEIRDADTVALKGDRTIMLSSIPARNLDEADFRIANNAAHWIYAEATKDVEARHTFFVNSLTREWQTADNWFDGLRMYGGVALDAAGNYYRRYLSDATVETIKSLGDLRKNLADDVAKVTQQTRDLIGMLWRDFALALVAIAARAAIGPENAALAQALLYAAAVFLTVSLVMTLLTNARFGRLLINTWAEWRKRLYGYLTNDDYQGLAERPLAKASGAYRGTAWAIALLYGVTVSVILVLSQHFPYQKTITTAPTAASKAPAQTRSTKTRNQSGTHPKR